ncbi:MAG: hypothetical protein K9H49_17635 [Bacteroidales bacterium]|nr:hypothetical protein [Bacteroidales bacterium]MCF8404088.1 hypothetical protein [Bacteroidales bacterium]
MITIDPPTPEVLYFFILVFLMIIYIYLVFKLKNATPSGVGGLFGFITPGGTGANSVGALRAQIGLTALKKGLG